MVLQGFTPEHLTARLKAIESIIGNRWLQVDEDSFEVRMHQTADEIITEIERNIVNLDDGFLDIGSLND